MKYIKKILLALWLIIGALSTQAQDVRTLVKEGIDLSNARNYAGAIEKYKAALGLEPDNVQANYQLAFTLQASGKGQEALPYLQKVVQSNSSAAVMSSAYGLMGSIYDQAGQAQKAVDSYEQAIKADSGSYALHYGLGLAYFRNHQYAQAERSAITALRIDPQQAASVRLYALVCFHQNKRAAALLGFCRYLQMEPNGAKSAEANGNIDHILQGGDLKPEPGVPAPRIDARTAALNQVITQATASMSTRRYASVIDLLAEELKLIFTSAGQLAAKQAGGEPFFKQLAADDYRLAQSAHMPAFARYIRQNVDKTAAAWLQSHPQQVAALQEWMKGGAL